MKEESFILLGDVVLDAPSRCYKPSSLKIVFKNDWIPTDRRLRQSYQEIQGEFPQGVWKFESNGKLETLSKERQLGR